MEDENPYSFKNALIWPSYRTESPPSFETSEKIQIYVPAERNIWQRRRLPDFLKNGADPEKLTAGEPSLLIASN